MFDTSMCPWCGWGFMWPFGGWGLGVLWFIVAMLFWVLLLVLLVAGVIYVLRYLFTQHPRRSSIEELEDEIRRLKAKIEDLERRKGSGG